MNQNISIEKIFEMYGRTSLERDLQRNEIERLLQVAKQPPEKKENKKPAQ